MSKRWNELDYYKEGQTLHGRDEEICSVSTGIERNIQTVIYGQSGVGKSSLLFAGVFPELRKKGFFPIFIRLGAIPPQDYIKYIKDIVLKVAQTENRDLGKYALNCSIKDIDIHNNDDLWSFFHSTEFSDNNGDIYIPVLVFDQFEEILNDKNTYEYAQQLLLELYTLMDNTRIIPDNCIQYSNYRVVFSLREDYLYCLEELVDKFNLSELRYNRYRIKWLSRQNARKVILNTFGESLSPENSDEICNTIIDKTTNESGDISTIYLSLICSILDMKYEGGIIELRGLNSIDDYIYKYYKQKMDVVSYKAKKYLEQHLITPDGRRNSLDYYEAIRSGQITLVELDLLIENRMLRKVTLTGNSRIEYIHDVIAKLVVKKTHNAWYYVKKTFKERHNITGTASKEEMVKTNIFLCTLQVVSPSLIAFGISFTDNYDFLGLWIFLLGVIFYYIYKLMLSLQIRRAHDVGISGWTLFSSKYNGESELIPYIPKTSYYYCQSSSFKNIILGIFNSTQFTKLGICKYEFLANFVKGTKIIYWMLLFSLSIYFLDFSESFEMAKKSIILMFCLVLIYPEMINVSLYFYKRLNYMNVNPWHGLIPFYNIYLYVKCFKNDTLENNLYKTKIRYIIYPFIVSSILLFVLFMIIWTFSIIDIASIWFGDGR